MKAKTMAFLGALLILVGAFGCEALAQGQEGGSEEITSGFVFHNARYVEAPYRVEVRDLAVFINGIEVRRKPKWPPRDLRVPDDPGLPVGVTREAGLAALDTVRGQDGSPHMGLKVRYLYQHFPKEEARERIVGYFRSLPYLRSVEAVHDYVLKLEDYYGASRLVDISYVEVAPPPTREEYERLAEKAKENIALSLEKGYCIFYFEDGQLLISAIKAARVLPNAVRTLSDASLDAQAKKEILEQLGILREDNLWNEILIGNFKTNPQLDQRLMMLRDQIIRERGPGVLEEGPGGSSLKEKPFPEGSRGVAYSPDGIYLYVYYGNAWQRPYDTEISSISNHIMNQDYEITTCIWMDLTDDDNDPGSCTLANWKDCRWADMLSIHCHGNIGYFCAVYLKDSAAVSSWRGTENYMETVQSGSVIWGDPPYHPYYARVLKQWPWENWNSLLTQSQAIVFVNSCDGNAKVDGTSFLTCCGGGVGFGYPGDTYWGNRVDNNNELLPRMNGTKDGGAHRKAGEAYDNMPFHYDNLEMEGYPDITLCPAYEAKYPTGEVGQSGTGYFQVDTYCHDSVSADQVLTFQITGQVTISNLHWVGGDQVNQIEFDWNGAGYWSVTVTAHAEEFHSWGAATGSHHRMDGDRVAPNGDDVVWTFYSPYVAVPSLAIWGFIVLTLFILIAGAWLLSRTSSAV